MGLNDLEKQFDAVVEKHHASIYRICRAYCYDKSMTADLYQEVLVQLWKSLGGFREHAQLSTWIYRVTVNTAITFNTRSMKHQFVPLSGEEQLLSDNDLMEKLEQEARYDQLHTAIQQLEKHDRLLIALVLEGRSYKDIAEIIGSNANNIGVRVSRIKERLTKLI